MRQTMRGVLVLGMGDRMRMTMNGRWVRGGVAPLVALFFLIGLHATPAWSENPAPSVHWGSTAFPDQYSTLTGGLTLNRFTPVDGLGNKYDSTVGNTLGFNLITLSWTQHWGG
ncbi:MAG: hypothetical protein HP496_02370, partial [Nitrospira sp.]|nr:hypothetical protein [Nitrospira sp.]